jgi:hypothetical protein
MENPIHFENIRKVWFDVRLGLLSLKAKCPNLRWNIEDVYAECVNGTALLWHEDGRFVIFKSYVDELTLAKVLWVWVACGKGLLEQQARLDDFAREEGYDEIRLTSPRLGWTGIEGWQFMDATYSRKL